jgi:hypothetical protein
MKMLTNATRLAGCSVVVLALVGCANGLESVDNGNGNSDPGPAVSGSAGDMQAHFEATGSLETSCGETAGVRLSADGPDGKVTGCETEWISYETEDGLRHIADCFFVVEPGLYEFTELSAIDADGDALACCDSQLPPDANVAPSETTEVSGSITCDMDQNGALDVFVTINRPPVIEDLEISPSKFGATCEAINLTVTASDSEGEELTYEWSVISSPGGSKYSLLAKDNTAVFAAEQTGDYELRVVARDPMGATSQLDFPIHIVEASAEACDADEVCEDEMDDGDDDDDSGN